MNVLRNQIGKIGTATTKCLNAAEKVKVAIVDSYFEDRVGIENVKAAFDIYSDAKSTCDYIHKITNEIIDENEDAVCLIYSLKEELVSIYSKINALERVLKSL